MEILMDLHTNKMELVLIIAELTHTQTIHNQINHNLSHQQIHSSIYLLVNHIEIAS